MSYRDEIFEDLEDRSGITKIFIVYATKLFKSHDNNKSYTLYILEVII